jgi:hypothetical protein
VPVGITIVREYMGLGDLILVHHYLIDEMNEA